MGHIHRAAIWTLRHKSKKPTRVDAYVDAEYCAEILANSITNCRTSRVWHDPLSRLDLAAAMQQQHCPLAWPAAVAWPTSRQTEWNDYKAHSLRTWRKIYSTHAWKVENISVAFLAFWRHSQVQNRNGGWGEMYKHVHCVHPMFWLCRSQQQAVTRGEVITLYNGIQLKWVDTCKYLGVHFLRGRNFRCTFEDVKQKFFSSFNAVYSKIGRFASEEVVLNLLNTKCISSMLYGTEACPVMSWHKHSFDFTVTRVFMKILHTNSKSVVEVCMKYFGFVPMSQRIDNRTARFLDRFISSDNMLCTLRKKHKDTRTFSELYYLYYLYFVISYLLLFCAVTWRIKLHIT